MSAEPPLIRGSVARVVTARELVINRGLEHGVTRGMIFAVLDPRLVDVVDPETGDSLGTIPRVTVFVRVTQAQERLALAKTFQKRTVVSGGSGSSLGGIAALFEPRREVVRYKTLRAEDGPAGDIDEANSYVNTGDPVVEVRGATDEQLAGWNSELEPLNISMQPAAEDVRALDTRPREAPQTKPEPTREG